MKQISVSESLYKELVEIKKELKEKWEEMKMFDWTETDLLENGYLKPTFDSAIEKLMERKFCDGMNAGAAEFESLQEYYRSEEYYEED